MRGNSYAAVLILIAPFQWKNLVSVRNIFEDHMSSLPIIEKMQNVLSEIFSFNSNIIWINERFPFWEDRNDASWARNEYLLQPAEALICGIYCLHD